MKRILCFAFASLSLGLAAQTSKDSLTNPQNQVNAAQQLLASNLNQKGLTIGGYAETHYNRATGKNAKLVFLKTVIKFGRNCFFIYLIKVTSPNLTPEVLSWNLKSSL